MQVEDPDYLALIRHGLSYNQGVVLVADVVGSVKLIEASEQATVSAWIAIFNLVIEEILPAHEGRLIKSLGDGFIAEFTTIQAAAAASFAIQAMLATKAQNKPSLYLKIGLEVGQYYRGALDIYGHTVNLAARIAALAGAGDIFLSEAAKNALTVDSQMETIDLGFHHLKNVMQPMRIFKLKQRLNVLSDRHSFDDSFKPTLAFIPFNCHSAQDIMGLSFSDMLCEEFIRHLSPQRFFNLIARTSAAQFRHNQDNPLQVGSFLKAHFVVSGHYFCHPNELELYLTLTDCTKNSVLLQQTYRVPLSALFGTTQEEIHTIIYHITQAINQQAVHAIKGRDFKTIHNYQLLIAALALMNRLDQNDFFLAQQILQSLHEKLPSHIEPRALLAQWYNLKVQQGWSEDIEGDSQKAIALCMEVLAQNPEDSLALSVAGLLTTTLHHECEKGRQFLEEGLLANPNNPLAWLFHSANRMFAGDGERAVLAAQRARYLAPFDPQKYLYDSLLASAFIIQGNDHEALNYIQFSLQQNALHVSSHRVRIIALWRLGLEREAKQDAQYITKINQGFSVNGWLQHSPLKFIPQGKEFANILIASGLKP